MFNPRVKRPLPLRVLLPPVGEILVRVGGICDVGITTAVINPLDRKSVV